MLPFIASNGVTISLDSDGDLRFSREPKPDTETGFVRWDGESGAALREFVLAEIDAQLGRWRSKEHPDYVVYLSQSGSVDLLVMDERTGGVAEYVRRFDEGSPCHASDAARVAREYFNAHLEPKPWHDAKPGELWVLTGAGGLEQAWLRTRDERWAHATSEALRLYAKPEGIIAGRRIYPEVQP